MGADDAAFLFLDLMYGLLHGRLIFGLGPRGIGWRPGSFPGKIRECVKGFTICHCKCKRGRCKDRLMRIAVFPTRWSFRVDRDGG